MAAWVAFALRVSGVEAPFGRYPGEALSSEQGTVE